MRFVVIAIWVLVFAAMGCSEDPLPTIGSSCQTLADCAAGDRLVCQTGVCGRLACVTTASCPVTAACVQGFCDAPECGNDSDCGDGSLCYQGDCRSDICGSKADCEDTQVCRGAPPTCGSAPLVCSDDTECTGDLKCVLPFGTCKSACNFDPDCTGDDYCRRGACTPPCADSTVCGGDEVCVDNQCVELQSCPVETCPPSRPFRNPVSCACVDCLNDSDCFGDQESCTSAGRCVYCPSKGDTESCAAQGLIEDEGCCTQCINDVDCVGTDRVCDSGICVLADPRECTVDNDCGPGTCENGLCRPGGSLAACSLQAECATEEACYGDGRCRDQSDACECDSGSRCVAEPGDVIGSCVGCGLHCGQEGCSAGTVCVLRGEATEGTCMPAALAICP